MKDQIENLREEAINRYILNDFDLIRDVEIEMSDVNGYHGREILELLQNIDDAFEKSGNHTNTKPVIADIKFKDNVLTVSNTGTEFDFEGIKALVFGHISPKGNETIGNKGSGFRSVLNWSKKVEIFSGGYKVRFSQDFAKDEFNKVAHKENIKIQIEQQLSKGKEELCFPILSMPQYIDEEFVLQYDTVIKIYIEEELNVGDYSLENQLNKLDEDYRTLLFLPNLNQINIETNNISKKYIKEIDIDKLDLINLKMMYDGIEKNEYYYSKKKNLENLKGNKYLLIAIPKDFKLDDYNIYSYFPTKEKSPFPVLMHAPFILSSDRNYIPTDNKEFNKELFKELLVLLIEMANELKCSNYINNNSHQAIDIITPNNLTLESWEFQGKFGDFNLEHFFFENVKDAKVFPLINGGFTGIVDGVKWIKQEVPFSFKCDSFRNLLDHLNTNEKNNLVIKIAEMNKINIEFTEEELCDSIEQINQVSVSNNVEMFIWWNNYYIKSKIFPNLLKDSNDSWIDYTLNDKIFLPTDTGINTLPSNLNFATLVVLSDVYTNEFIRKIQSIDNLNWQLHKNKYDSKTTDKRILSSYSEKFKNKFIEQSSREIIIRSVNDQIKDSDQAIKFIVWLYSLYNQSHIYNDDWIKKIPYKLPTDNGIENVNNVYIGDKWFNKLGSMLFLGSEYKQFISPTTISINNDEVDKFIDFLIIIGVKKYPEIYKTSFNNFRFNSYLTSKYNFGFNINFVDTYIIDNFEYLLKKLDTKIIVDWVKLDHRLSEILFSQNRDSHATQQRNWSGKYFLSNEYLLYVLNQTPWIEINGNKYKPIQIVTYEKVENYCLDIYGINESKLKLIVGNDLFNLLDFKDSLGQLNSKQINNLLYKLPEFDKTGEISRKLYLEIIRYKQNTKPSLDYNLKNIKVLCKTGKYIELANVKYADKIYPSKVERDHNFIWIHPKQSTETIKTWLGVSRFEMSLELVYKVENHKLMKQFDAEINHLKVAILSIIEGNQSNINKIRNIKIVPCLEIKTKDQSEDEIKLDDYFYIENDNVVYIKLPNEIDNITNLLNKTEFSLAVFEIFKYHLTLELDESLINWLISKNRDDRKKIISSRYGIDKWNDTYKILNKTNLINETIYNWFNENNLNNELLLRIQTFDFTNSSSINFDVLIKSLKSLNKNIYDLHELDETLFISFKDYWRQKIKFFIQTHEEIYKVNLFEELLGQDKSKQESYLNNIKQFKEFTLNDSQIPDDIIFEYEKLITQKFKPLEAKFNSKINLEKIYYNNFMKLDFKTNDDRFNDYINENLELGSLIYFLNNEYEELIINSFIESIPSNEKDDESIVFEEDENKEFVLTDKIVEARLTKPAESNTDAIIQSTRTKTSREKVDKSKHKNGQIAERTAYNALLTKHSTLKWTSENADKGMPERNTSAIYDMYYMNDKGKVYVEIKVLGSEFFMSVSEYNFAKSNEDSYELYFVNLENYEVSAAMKISDYENVKTPTEYKFSINNNLKKLK